MTRINIIEPEYLLDQHLLAEYNETSFVISSLRRSKESGNPLKLSNGKYTLNAGHVLFFYNKGKFLKKRYESLKAELKKRGFNLDSGRELNWSEFSSELMNDWKPTIEEQRINIERILTRFKQKPEWYKYQKKQADISFWQELYSTW